jgi:hypothetical protein
LISSIEATISELARPSREKIPLRRVELVLFLMAWMREPSDPAARKAAFVSSVLTYCWKAGGSGLIEELPPRFRHLIIRTVEVPWLARAASGDIDGQPYYDSVKSNYSKNEFEPFIVDVFFCGML